MNEKKNEINVHNDDTYTVDYEKTNIDNMKNVKLQPIIDDEWYGNKIKIRPFITMSEMFDIVDTVTKVCISADNMGYAPEIKNFMLFTMIIKYYTNITLPEDVNEIYNIFVGTNLNEFVISKINANQYADISKSIDLKIKYNIGIINNKLMAQIQDIVNKMNNITTDMENAISDIDEDEMKRFLKNMEQKDITTSDIVKEIIKATNGKMNSEKATEEK